MNNFVKYSFLEKTINISFPEGWKVEHKDYNLAEVKFPFGPYPTLGCYFKCFDGPKINSEEVASWKWMPMDELIQDMAEHRDQYTVWFKIIFDKYCEHLGL